MTMILTIILASFLLGFLIGVIVGYAWWFDRSLKKEVEEFLDEIDKVLDDKEGKYKK